VSEEANIRGMLSLPELASMVKEGKIETIIIAFTDLYGKLLGKRCDADYFINENARHDAHACNYLLSVDMEMNPVPGYAFSNWEKGYGDFHLVPDFSTLRIASWLDRTALVLSDLYDETTHELISIAPRSILRRQVENANELQLTPFAATELEYYLFQDSFKAAAETDYTRMKPAGWYIEDYHILQGTREEVFNAEARRHLKNSGIPAESSKGEWGLGQHELNIRFADILIMADRHCLFKQCLKEIADQKQMAITFMAKIHPEQAGSSCHIHISMWQNGENAFVGKDKIGSLQASALFRWFLGGWIAHAAEVMVFYAPNINSYKRYQAGSWAPTRLAWSYDNRTAGFRVVGQDAGLRIECRIPGADCNPYLALAASLASGLDGIKNHIEPPAAFQGDLYQAKDLPRVPETLQQATDLFEKSEFAASSFGSEVVEHYAHFFRTEVAAFNKTVTDWEKKRYFERI
jgi:glutamine synthetase